MENEWFKERMSMIQGRITEIQQKIVCVIVYEYEICEISRKI